MSNQRQSGFRNSRRMALGLSITLVLCVAPLTAGAAAQQELLSGQVIERGIAGGEAQSFHLTLVAGEFVRVAIDQKGIDLIIALFSPEGERLNYFTSPDLTQGIETVSWVTRVGGSYRVEIRATEEQAAAGRYQLRVLERRPTSTAQDRAKVAAERAFMEGEELRNEWKADSLKSSLKKYDEALSFSQSAGDQRLEGATLNIIGLVHEEMGDKPRALDYFQRAHPVRRKGGDLAGEAQSLHNVGVVYFNMEEIEKAFEYYNRALKANAISGDRAIAAVLFSDNGNRNQALGRFQQAFEKYEQALAVWSEIGYRRLQAVTLVYIGSSYQDLGDDERALKYFVQSQELFHELGIRRKELDTLNRIASLHLNAGDYQRAVARLLQAQRLHDHVADEVVKADTLSVLARYATDMGEYKKALDYYGQVVDLMGRLDERSGQAVAIFGVGIVHLQQGNYRNAVKNFNQALVVFQNVKNRRGEAVALSYLMDAWKKLNDPRLAVFFGKQAVNFFQEIRGNLRGLEKGLQKSFLKITEHPYRVLAELLILEGRLPEAQQVLGLLKEEEYFQFLRRDGNEATSLTGRAELTPEEAAQEKRYRENSDRLTAIGVEYGQLRDKQSLTPEEEQRLDKLESDLMVANQVFQRFLDELEKAFSRSRSTSDLGFQLRESQGLMETLRELGSGSVALYTIVGEDKYWVILVTAEVQKAYERSIKGTEINRKVLEFREAVQNPRVDPRPLGQELYKILVGAELARDLVQAKAQTLMWSLDGVLRYLPITALHDGEKYMVERYRNVVFTPASQSRLKDSVSKKWKALGFGVSKAYAGFSPLPGVTEELRGIIRDETRAAEATPGVLPGKVMLDEAFTAASLQTALRQRYPLVHIASHFSFKPGNETDSFLLLGDGSRLTLAQIKSLPNVFSGVDLLTLSACDTATGGAGASGKEVEGFGVLAQRQGAKAVMATLWPVVDISTQLLMREFYRLREANPQWTKAEALRQAQLSLMSGTIKVTSKTQSKRADMVGSGAQRISTKQPWFESDPKAPFAHPYYWAPFILIGNWK